MSELDSAISQLDGLEGQLSFFDTMVTDPVPFSAEEMLEVIRPTGGGGTSFMCIFKYLKKLLETDDEEDWPVAVIILTDGYADFPEEKVTMGIPVLWIICDSDVKPPWGRVIHIDTRSL